MNHPRRVLTFFVALTLLYVAFSPLSIGGMGYASENAAAAQTLLTWISEFAHHHGSTATMAVWPRHGPLEPVLEIPFVLVGGLLFGGTPAAVDHILALDPILASALLCSVVFAWTERITERPAWALCLAMVAAFATMIWPYAYLGLETTQSAALLAAGYLALADRRATWSRVVWFALCAAVAVSVKSNGLYLVPAVAFLFFAVWRNTRALQSTTAVARLTRLATAAIIVAVIYGVNAHYRARSADYAANFWTVFMRFRTDTPTTFVLNGASLWLSLNKGLLMYAPVVALALVSWRQAYRSDPAVALFAALTAAGLTIGSALVFFWTDETWGPRYLHAAIAPMIVCLATTRRGAPLRLKTEWPLAALAAAGAVVSLLGTMFYYGALHVTATAASEARLETLQYDVRWNPVRFHGVLLKTWLDSARSSDVPMPRWPPDRHRWFPAAGETLIEPGHVVDIRPYASPQPYVLRRLRDWSDPLRWGCITALIGGTAIVIQIAVRSRARPPIARVARSTIV